MGLRDWWFGELDLVMAFGLDEMIMPILVLDLLFSTLNVMFNLMASNIFAENTTNGSIKPFLD